MSGEIEVSFEQLGNTAEKVRSTTAELERLLGDLKANLAPTAASWSGKAAEAWQGHQQRWDSSYEDLKGVLGQIGRALESANQNYQDAESRNVKRWG
ncbi:MULTISPECIES: WXG100 family type VII secretion target [unclassified Crossiella]|uniref:WXG100 family type VII secretion target n=1 Tax=unclassified Crossiella TaxID=2620835 RepID=UPI001FFE31BD|nr:MULTISPECIES: WXG100 family type VII secretion target [unclassified Crossiella]MCK2237578.1 WXG100 family type VII secretion target [Crossiella sp. S99.2]MCK2254864.1 WXG100 family type VII secretion target [Crossiella sp. S99.1]